jgi:hypothetical protein
VAVALGGSGLGHYHEAFLFRQLVDGEILLIKGNNVLNSGYHGEADNSGVGKIHRIVGVFLHQAFDFLCCCFFAYG